MVPQEGVRHNRLGLPYPLREPSAESTVLLRSDFSRLGINFEVQHGLGC